MGEGGGKEKWSMGNWGRREGGGSREAESSSRYNGSHSSLWQPSKCSTGETQSCVTPNAANAEHTRMFAYMCIQRKYMFMNTAFAVPAHTERDVLGQIAVCCRTWSVSTYTITLQPVQAQIVSRQLDINTRSHMHFLAHNPICCFFFVKPMCTCAATVTSRTVNLKGSWGKPLRWKTISNVTLTLQSYILCNGLCLILLR